MSKSRSFSIYLMKQNVDAPSALKKDNTLGGPADGDALPESATLCVWDKVKTPDAGNDAANKTEAA